MSSPRSSASFLDVAAERRAREDVFVEVLGVLEPLHHHERRCPSAAVMSRLRISAAFCRRASPPGSPSVIVRLLVIRSNVLIVASPVQVRAGELELGRVPRPVHRVRAEQPAEEQHFRGQEHPHPQPLGGVLLLQVVEVVLQHR